MRKKHFVLSFLLGAASLAASGAALAQQAFPTHPIRLIVPFAPGSGTDNTARHLAREMEAEFGSPVVVENHPGANSFIAAKMVAAAAPDGYTLLISGSSAMTVNAAIFKALPYDPLKDFAPVARLAKGAMGLAVNAQSPYRSVDDLVQAMRQQPGTLNYGSGSAAYQITTELFLSMAQAKASHIPYKGAAQALTDLAGRQVDFAFADYAALVPFLRSGKLRLLAVSSAERLESEPATPTVAQAGYPGFDMVNWTSAFAPAGTPAPIVDTLSKAIVAIYEREQTRAFLAGTNWESFPVGPAELRRYQVDEIAKWSRAAEIAGIEKQ
ncbi:tripartite tricarboxylate transporter substrate binding protein [Bordetella parapertussis]|uniref:Exported protein n=5 Tax=Bordetella TaxID=517 RepID=A0A0H3LN16_BORBR|nr:MULTISPECIES: tripartite tricarboxylate transporter substrate binding protein [Bordetella]KAK69281.1 tripartite tricarboxylate transporter family receptor [Bordetella bronchiseptica 980-2]KCV31866.1 tripartite tricarboxylate transporter family receptor [Bordetella bronchiseptica 00-P-2730]SHS35700.1 periplasmic solute-binding protein [Mycobacteroides abscessus subsp. abscessus]AMG88984.1 tripartite tricarboxylate transporter substrate binding protein [Bordetella bronchiseptica]AOB39778.1 AB